MRRIVVTMAGAYLAILAGCTPAQRSHMLGEQTKRDIYLNLMTQEEAEKFYEMETEWRDDEQMLLYCQEIGVYQKWRAAPEERQKLIRRRQIVEGMAPDEVRMAWGQPAQIEDITSAAERSEGHRRELWGYDPSWDDEGKASFARQVCFLDDRLLWHKDFRDTSLWKRMKWWER